MRGFLSLAAGIFTLLSFTLAFPQPEQIYGVNLGSWYLSEFHVLRLLVTILTQVIGRTLDAPGGCVIGQLHSSSISQTNPPLEWIAMGGQNCTNCQDCIRSELCANCNYP